MLRELGTEGKRRDKAERTFSETIRRHWLGDVEVPEREHLERHGISAFELRLAIQVVLHSLPAPDKPAGEWSRTAFHALTDHAFGNLSQPAVTRAFLCPKKMQLKPAIRLASTSTKARDQARRLRGNTIHGVKGEQFDAVLVLIPPAKRLSHVASFASFS
ncbi:hypothetical protein OHB56_32320 [Streptomyces sp. NBC_01635]|uniref:hypothetical protein n=1 Tax=Streptomyces sp. NBC_01635 TaxID=2975904 RepID=UPI003863226E|nr:hypothetical protein OHB56_32320 [Streptomyces sp. NBC_01635]